MIRSLLVAAVLFASCASSKSYVKGSPEDVCSFAPKNCPAMSEGAFAECVHEMKARQGAVCYPQLLGLKDCFAKMTECDASGELVESENGAADCNYEKGELDTCCADHAGDAACDF